MKKIYSKPEITVVHMDLSSSILNTSGGGADSIIKISDDDMEYGNKGDENPSSGGWVEQR